MDANLFSYLNGIQATQKNLQTQIQEILQKVSEILTILQEEEDYGSEEEDI